MGMQAFRKILVDLDAMASAQPALDRAVRLARLTGATLRIVNVVSTSPDGRHSISPALDDDLLRRRRDELARIAYGIRGVPVDTDLLSGPPADALIRDVIRFGHDLIVRSHARDLIAAGAVYAADVALELVRRCPCPVWAVGPGAPAAEPRIVGAIDVTEEPARQRLNAKVIEAALAFTRLMEGSLTLVHAWRPSFEGRVESLCSAEEFAQYADKARRTAKASLAAIADTFGSRLAGVRFELRRGSAEDVVPQFVVDEDVDLLVIGTTGKRRFLRRLLGSTAERLLRRVPCSLVTVKPDEFAWRMPRLSSG